MRAKMSNNLSRLKRLKINGYRSIKALDIELKPLNILIGANGAGKSNFIGFFKFMKKNTTYIKVKLLILCSMKILQELT